MLQRPHRPADVRRAALPARPRHRRGGRAAGVAARGRPGVGGRAAVGEDVLRVAVVRRAADVQLHRRGRAGRRTRRRRAVRGPARGAGRRRPRRRARHPRDGAGPGSGCGSAGSPTRSPGGPPRAARCSASAAASRCSASASRTRSSRGPGTSTGSGCCPYGCGSRREKTLARPAAGARRARRGLRDPSRRRRGHAAGERPFLDGCRVGAVWGTHWHGSLECDGFRRAFLREVARRRGPPVRAGARTRRSPRCARSSSTGSAT